MAKQPTSSGSSKNKDDDSWGKLASDLLGIQFGGPDDDFDLPDEEAPPAKPVVADNAAVPFASSESRPVVAQQQAEPDLSFPEDDEEELEADAEEDVEPITTAEASADPRDENEPDIWDKLESWNWDEPVKPAPRSHSDPPSGRSGDRSGRRGPGGPPRDRDGGRDRSRGRDEERPRPPRDAAAPAVEQTPRERPPRREEAPRREDRPPRSESRDEPPRSEQRPARRPESTEQHPPRSAPPRTTVTATPDDGFAAGLDDEPKPRRAPAAPSRPAESAVAPPARRPAPAPAPAPTRASNDDNFAMDLFQELARDADEAGTETTGNAGESGGESSNEDRPRRRRRRRRGGRGRRPESVAGQSDTDDGPDSEEHDDEDQLAFASDDDSSTSDSEDDEASEARPESADEEGGEQRQPRRRRRRGPRRPDERPTEAAVVGADKRSESEDDDDDDEPMARSERVEEEPLAPVNYEGIPTWEEAISYLIRTRGPEPRGRGDGGSRGRGGPPHRR